jgi:hypothetical protein
MKITFDIEDSLYAAAIKEYGSEEAVVAFIMSEWQRITVNNVIRDVQAQAAAELEVALATAVAEVTGKSVVKEAPIEETMKF